MGANTDESDTEIPLCDSSSAHEDAGDAADARRPSETVPDGPRGRWIVSPPHKRTAVPWCWSPTITDTVPFAEVPHAPRGAPVNGVDTGEWVRADNGLYLRKRLLVPSDAFPMAGTGAGVVVHEDGAAVLATCEMPSKQEELRKVWLQVLPPGTPVLVDARRGRRARISFPTDGWVSVAAGTGVTIVADDGRPAVCGVGFVPQQSGGGLMATAADAVRHYAGGTVVEKGLCAAEGVMYEAASVMMDPSWQRTARSFSAPPEDGESLADRRDADEARAAPVAALKEAATGMLTSLWGMATAVGAVPQPPADAPLKPGVYRVCRSVCITETEHPSSTVVTELDEGACIAVADVLVVERRWRGRCVYPAAGWVSLRERCASPHTWAEAVEEQMYWAAPPHGQDSVQWRESPSFDSLLPDQFFRRGNKLSLQTLSGDWAVLRRGCNPPLYVPSAQLCTEPGWSVDRNFRTHQRVEVMLRLQFPSGKAVRAGEVGVVRSVPGSFGTQALVEMPPTAQRPRFCFSARAGWVRHVSRFVVGQRVQLVMPVCLESGRWMRPGAEGTVRELPGGDVAAVVEADPLAEGAPPFLFNAKRGWLCPADVPPTMPHSIGDSVQWLGADADIPAGSVGTVVGWFEVLHMRPPRLLVEFPRGTFSFDADRLAAASAARPGLAALAAVSLPQHTAVAVLEAAAGA
eukprot:TRINITY_DN46967_c0_g1_i1.p1 TRINITY_DN46967_c0_g1~~TRINITY_DN46967_c0_g1_i1.p1  ORF type:complete len:689 (+),score=213.28 TRINITY_DN46967_c0_g1_i1:67-2133(+)